jgi:hypothetical protein
LCEVSGVNGSTEDFGWVGNGCCQELFAEEVPPINQDVIRFYAIDHKNNKMVAGGGFELLRTAENEEVTDSTRSYKRQKWQYCESLAQN